MSHDGYVAFMLAMTTLFPLVIVALTGSFRASRYRRSDGASATSG